MDTDEGCKCEVGDDGVSCIFRFRLRVIGPILVMDTPEAVVVVVTAEAVEAT